MRGALSWYGAGQLVTFRAIIVTFGGTDTPEKISYFLFGNVK